MDAAQRVARAVLARADELDRVADARGERDAARLVAAADRHRELAIVEDAGGEDGVGTVYAVRAKAGWMLPAGLSSINSSLMFTFS
mgnify:CR=1 FL=1